MDIVSRLKRFITYLGLPNSTFADRAHITRPTLSQILNGRNKKISNELIAKLHEAFPTLNIMWLMFGDGDMLASEDQTATGVLQTVDGMPLSSENETVAHDTEDMVPYGNSGNTANAGAQTSPLEKANGFDLNFFELNQCPSQSVYKNTPTAQSSEQRTSSRNVVRPSHPSQPQDKIAHNENKTHDKNTGSSKSIPGSFWDDVATELPTDGNTAAASAAAAVADNGKSVSYIMVFYSDSSYEIFTPSAKPQR